MKREIVNTSTTRPTSKVKPTTNSKTKGPSQKTIVIKKTALSKGNPNSTKSVKKHRRHNNFKLFIFKVLKNVHKEMAISKRSMDVMNSFVHDIYERVAVEASSLLRKDKKTTLGAREIQGAVRMLLPGELAKHAIIEGVKALNKTKEIPLC